MHIFLLFCLYILYIFTSIVYIPLFLLTMLSKQDKSSTSSVFMVPVVVCKCVSINAQECLVCDFIYTHVPLTVFWRLAI